MPQLASIAVQTLFLLACAGQQGDPREEFLTRAERRIRLPPAAKPLEAYSRSYFPIEGGTKIMGIFSLLKPAGRHWVAQNPGPFIADGGCTIITVVIDVPTGLIEKTECNGVG